MSVIIVKYNIMQEQNNFNNNYNKLNKILKKQKKIVNKNMILQQKQLNILIKYPHNG